MAAKPINKKSNKIEPNWKVKQIGRVATSKMSLVDTSSIKSIKIHLMNKERCKKKRDYVGKIPNLGGGLTQTHFLMSIYQVIFGMPKWLPTNLACHLS